ncbi:methyltransferase [Sphingobium nicotianae]|uniref:O-methyltransferase C-terminal domain-containing protein n=1 Tax=Sphingobium nicotianae TaxID=2782607 RepID=A0A9X1DCE3_9SPHN|nr:methyltransferase [Sphingobium nicotianae]MBT2187299.1 hypothetical protein [Sphingobium nicotianae]
MSDARKVTEAITGAWRTRAIYEGTRAGLFDALDETPRTVEDLALLLGLDAPTCLRILRAIAVLGLCDQVSADAFVATPAGHMLRADASNSLRGMAMLWGDRIWRSLETLGDTLRTGEPGWGNGNFGAIHSDPAQSDIFNRAMAEQSVPIARALAQACDFSAYRNIIDVGGGYGAVLIEVLRANPEASGFVYDLGLIAAGAERYLNEADLGGRAGFRGGDFFSAVPEGSDCILLKYILHDWPDGDCRRILANIRAALAPGAAFLLLERILPERVGAQDEAVVRADLVMMPISGKERTEAEFRDMLGEAGFAVEAVKPLADGCWAIEARAV